MINEKRRKYASENELLEKYWKDNPGTLLKEVSVGSIPEGNRVRRIDAVRVIGGENRIYQWKDIIKSNAAEITKNKTIEVIEVKNDLNRGVIGQVLVAYYLAEKKLKAKDIIPVIICSKGHCDLEDFCRDNNIKLVLLD